jgi:dihydroflavonol-4-reductase
MKMGDGKERAGGASPRIAVTGGSGFVGSHVVELLLERGYDVNCLVLPEEGRAWLEGSRARLFEGSVTDRGCLAPFLEGCSAIVHIAGLTRAKTEARFLEVNAQGAVNLAEAALALPDGPRHMVSMSSMAAAGPCPDGGCLDEDEPLRPLTPYGRSKAALEDALRAYEGRIERTFIRAPGVYGPRDRDFLQYFRLVRRGLRPILGRRSVMSILYVKTLARAIADCVLNPSAYGHAFFIADEGEYDWDDLSAFVEEALGARTMRIAVPDWAVAIAAAAAEAIKPFARRPPLLDRHKLLEMRQGRWVVSTAKARRLLGFEPAISTRDAMAETAKWYVANGWI